MQKRHRKRREVTFFIKVDQMPRAGSWGRHAYMSVYFAGKYHRNYRSLGKLNLNVESLSISVFYVKLKSHARFFKKKILFNFPDYNQSIELKELCKVSNFYVIYVQCWLPWSICSWESNWDQISCWEAFTTWFGLDMPIWRWFVIGELGSDLNNTGKIN